MTDAYEIYLGCDSGMDGAIAAQTYNGRVFGIWDMPTHRPGRYKAPDCPKIAALLRPFSKHRCLMTLENVFTFGAGNDTPLTAWQLSAAIWTVRATAEALGMTLWPVPLSQWKRHYQLWGLGREEAKLRALDIVKRQFPQAHVFMFPEHKTRSDVLCNPKPDRAEALLICDYRRKICVKRDSLQ